MFGGKCEHTQRCRGEVACLFFDLILMLLEGDVLWGLGCSVWSMLLVVERD